MSSDLVTYELDGAVAVIGLNRPKKRNAINNAVVSQLRDAVGDAREAALNRQNNAVVQGVALGRAVEADGEHRAGLLDGEQRGLARWCGGGGVSHDGIGSKIE